MKKFSGRAQKIKTDVVGLDVHKDVIAFCHLDTEGDAAHEGTIDPTCEEILKLVNQVAEGREIHVTMEASGGMLWLYDDLVEHLDEDHVHVAQPRRIRAIANSQEKNDGNDAYWLAYYTYEGRLPEAYIPVGIHRDLRVACRARREAVRQRSRAAVLVRSYLRQLGKDIPTARLDAAASQSWLEELIAETPGTMRLALQVSLDRWRSAGEDVALWEDHIAELAESMPAVERLRESIPGVGPVLAALIAAESGPITRFRTAKAYARYTGMTPSDRSTSGRTIHGGMTREGSAHLRWALNQAVMACRRTRGREDAGAGGAVARWVDRKERRMGSKGKARVAAARKLATCIWWLFNAPDQFDASKPFAA